MDKNLTIKNNGNALHKKKHQQIYISYGKDVCQINV